MQATRLLKRSVTSAEDLLSEGVFFMHFVLLVYDICNPVTEDNLWSHHLQHLLRIATHRGLGASGNETFFNIMGFALMIDAHASLAGSGGGIVKYHVEAPLLTIERLRSRPARAPCTRYYEQEVDYLHPLTVFNFEALDMMARCSYLALRLRQEYNTSADPQQLLPAHLGNIGQFQAEMYGVWVNSWPAFLPRDSPLAGARLTPRLRLLFENVRNSRLAQQIDALLTLIKGISVPQRHRPLLVYQHVSGPNACESVCSRRSRETLRECIDLGLDNCRTTRPRSTLCSFCNVPSRIRNSDN